jgi:hypothetical protein
MKKKANLVISAVSVCAIQGTLAWASPITAGDLLVFQQGTAATPTNGNAGVPIQILEFSTTGTAGQGFNIPTSSLVTDSAGSEGDLSLSANGTLLSFTGYTGGSVSNETNAPNRAVGVLDANGNFSMPSGANYSYAASGTQTRAAYSADGTNYYMTDKNGIFYNGGTANLTGSQNTRDIKAFGNATYILIATAGQPIISLISPSSPSPGITSVTTTGLPGLPSAGDGSAVDFTMLSSGGPGTPVDTLYYADNTGIFKYILSAGTWTADGEITNLGSHLEGITAAADPVAGVDLYVTTSSSSTNKLEEVTDPSFTATAPASPSISTLYTAPTGDLLRGVSFAPVPEPTSMAAITLGCAALLARRNHRRSAQRAE